MELLQRRNWIIWIIMLQMVNRLNIKKENTLESPGNEGDANRHQYQF